MQVTSTDQASVVANSANSAATQAPALNYSDFLKLLIAQMQNQDPTNPMDSTQWVSQLASFSSVEQAMKANDKLDQILKNSALSDAGSLIGRTISTTDGQSLGVIASVTVEPTGLSATLQDGSVFALDGTVVVS